MEDEAVIAGLATFGSHSIRNRSCRKPPRWNGTDKFAIPTSTAIGPSGVKQRRKNRFSREQTKRANVSQAIWKIEEHTSELQSLMRRSYAVFRLKKKNTYYPP